MLPYRQVPWDGATVGDWAPELAGSVLVNLAGELVDRRPTPANIELLERSGGQPTLALAAVAATREAVRAARSRGRRIATPAALVRMVAVVLRTDPGLALTGRRCVPARLSESGFSFAYPSVDGALADLLARPS